MAKLPIAPVRMLIKDAGARRVSEDASKELARVLEQKGKEIAKKAVSLAEHARRQTVQAKDIREAAK